MAFLSPHKPSFPSLEQYKNTPPYDSHKRTEYRPSWPSLLICELSLHVDKVACLVAQVLHCEPKHIGTIAKWNKMHRGYTITFFDKLCFTFASIYSHILILSARRGTKRIGGMRISFASFRSMLCWRGRMPCRSGAVCETKHNIRILISTWTKTHRGPYNCLSHTF